jgi:oligosaccharide repeat unit polymerase
MNVFSGSKFITALATLVNFFITAVEKSRTGAYAASFARFSENAFLGSKLFSVSKRMPLLYPARIWGTFDRANVGLKASSDLFNPIFIFPLVYLAFVCISTYRPSNLALFSIFVGVLFFGVGVRLSKRVKIKNIALESESERIAIFLISLGVLALIYDLFQAGAIPLLKPTAKRYLNVTLTTIAMILVPGGILAISAIGNRLEKELISQKDARVYSLFILLGTTFLIALLGYRTQIIVSLLGCTIAMYYSRLIGALEVMFSFFAALLSISIAGYYRAIAEGGSVGLFDVIGQRMGLTLSIYDSLVNRFYLFGANHGTVLLSTFSSFFHTIPGPRLGPRTIVARMYGVQDISMTSTLFGTVVLDFGIPGIIVFALSLGFVIGLAYFTMKRTKGALARGIFSLLLAYTLVGVETGLVDLVVFLFFFTSFLILANPKR